MTSIMDFIHAGDLIFDVGANNGNKTNLFLEKNTRVICIEPQPNCILELHRKYYLNDSVVIINKGLADKNGTLELSVCTDCHVISTFSDEWKTGRFAGYNWPEKIYVDVVTLDHIISFHGIPKYCKIDVEGFEYQVLKGLSVGIPYISFEFTIEFLSNAKKCIKYLYNIGYRYFNYTKAEDPEFVFEEWVSEGNLFDLIIKDSDTDTWGDIYAALEA